MDPRLTLQQMRVLIALYTFRNRNTELAYPTREEISKRTGMPPSKISTATTGLEQLGWLTKDGNGGRSRAARYRVHVPVFTPKTVTESVTVTESALNGYRFGNETVTESVTGIEQTIHTITNHKSSAKPEKPESVTEQTWADWQALRKAKKAPVTTTVVNAATREAAKAGMTLEAFLQEWCSRGSIGLKAEWLQQRPQQNHAPRGKYDGAAAAIFEGATHV